MTRTGVEQETIYNYNNAEPTANVYTFDKSLMRKLHELSLKNPLCKAVRETEDVGEYNFPKKWIHVRPPRVHSEEQKAEMAKVARRNFRREEEEQS